MAAKIYGGRWETVKSLGEGGQGFAYEVRDTTDPTSPNRVLKRLKNKDRPARFKNEIEAVKRLEHPNIIKLIDYDLDAAEPYFVSEYCDGGTLSKPVSNFWKDDPVAALKLFAEVCHAVLCAHNNGIVHRDLKPDNIFLRSDSRKPVVGDFGICFFDEDGARVTLTDEGVGTRYFMAPELEGRRSPTVTKEADVYSLGKLLYWLVSDGETLVREEYRDIDRDLKGQNDDTYLGWDNIFLEHVNDLLDRMILKNPEERFHLRSIIPLVRLAARLIEGEFNDIAGTVPKRCIFCGIGAYQVVTTGDQGSESEVGDFGLTPVGGRPIRILSCRHCGNVQMFRLDFATAYARQRTLSTSPYSRSG